jgi:acyl carrier protein
MTETEILLALNQVFRDVFDDDDIVVTPETTAADIDGWDSQAHVNLIVAAEVRFGIRFRTAELESLHNVGEFIQLILAKSGGR